jgi:AbiV family abortive infection protein
VTIMANRAAAAKSQLKQYRGPLTPAGIAKGMNAARRNSARLASDARLLFENKRYASAFSLAVLAIEEAGKEPVLRGMAASGDGVLKKAWRDYRTHTEKNALWLLLGKLFDGARRAKDFLSMFVPNGPHTFALEQMKQLSLYTDCIREGQWSNPEEVITENLAKFMVKTAEIFSQSREIKTEEVELWVQYMKPVWASNDGSREQALIEWDKEIRRRGLAEKSNKMTMETFFVDGVPLPKDL